MQDNIDSIQVEFKSLQNVVVQVLFLLHLIL